MSIPIEVKQPARVGAWNLIAKDVLVARGHVAMHGA
jgi:hypothetical protein